MYVHFQIMHTLNKSIFLELIAKALKIVNNKISEEYPPYGKDEEPAILFKLKYHKQNANSYLSGIVLDCTKYIEEYYSDYDSTIMMGFEWGAGSAIDEFNKYINLFIQTLKNAEAIIRVIKYEDTNLQLAYWLITKEIYEIEMKLREVLNFVLFCETEKCGMAEILKQKLKIRHSINKIFHEANFENEIFSLDFCHYQKLFNSYPNIFTNSILEDINKVRIFRNSIMHNKGYTTIGPRDFWDSKERIFQFIDNFWINNNSVI